MAIASIYSLFSLQTYTVTVYDPTKQQFEQLANQSSIVISCPCRHLSMSYSSIMSIKPRFHQVCSSAFVQSEKWLSYWPIALADGSRPIFNPFDFRLAGYSFFSLLKEYCGLANTTIFNALTAFNFNQFYSEQALSQNMFEGKASGILEKFQHTVPII